MPAVVLLSGGLDSAVNLKQAVDDTGVAVALTFDYGQRAAAKEAAAASFMSQQLGVPHQLIALPWLAEISGSSLVDRGAEIPHLSPDELEDSRVTTGETARAVWVPNRNGVFVNIAAAFAESMGAEKIVAGFNTEEAATFPDNSAEYVAAANEALAWSTLKKPTLLSYTQKLAKEDIVRLGRNIDAPILSIWSCYEGGADLCWSCESCVRLSRALNAAGLWEWFSVNRMAP